jgi:hypothetical protein
MEEIPQGEPVKLFQLGDSFGFQYSLQLIGWNFFDEHEHLDLGKFDAGDSFLRYLMAIRHASLPYSSEDSEAFD